MADDDLLWRPEGAHLDWETPARRPDRVGRPPRRRRLGGSLVLLAAVVAVGTVAAAVVALRSTGRGEPVGAIAVQPVDFDTISATANGPDFHLDVRDTIARRSQPADPRRLPTASTVRWTAQLRDLDADASSSVLVGGSVIVALVDDASGQTVAAGFARDSGGERWRRSLEPALDDVTERAVVDGVVVIGWHDDTGRWLAGLDAESGLERWRRDVADGDVHSVVPGTPLIVRWTGETRVAFLDPASGLPFAELDARVVANDAAGRWWLHDGEQLLLGEFGRGWSSPQPVATFADRPELVVVDGRPVFLSEGRPTTVDDEGRPVALALRSWASRGIPPSRIDRLGPVAGSTLLFNTAGRVHGATLDGDTLDVDWRLDGSVWRTATTRTGSLVVVASEGGARQRVVDGSTGRTLTVLELSPGAIQSLELVGNGYVTKRTSVLGSARVGLDLDGNQMWSIFDEGRLVVGDGVVVRWQGTPSGAVVTAYG